MWILILIGLIVSAILTWAVNVPVMAYASTWAATGLMILWTVAAEVNNEDFIGCAGCLTVICVLLLIVGGIAGIFSEDGSSGTTSAARQRCIDHMTAQNESGLRRDNCRQVLGNEWCPIMLITIDWLIEHNQKVAKLNNLWLRECA